MKDLNVFKKMYREGVTPSACAGFAYKYRNWYELMKNKRIPTRLRIVYHGQDNRMVCLPFLALDAKDKVWGIEIDGTYYSRKQIGPVSRANIEEALADAEKKLFGPTPSEVYRCYGGTDNRLSLPALFELKALRRYRQDFAATERILLENGVEMDDWYAAAEYWYRSEASTIKILDATKAHRRTCKSKSEDQVCLLMPVIRSIRPVDPECWLTENFSFCGENEPEQTMLYL